MEAIKWQDDNTAEIRFDKKTRIKFSLINQGDDTFSVHYEQWWYRNHQPDYAILSGTEITPKDSYPSLEECRTAVEEWYTKHQGDIWLGLGAPFNPDDHVPTSGVTKFKGEWSKCPVCGDDEMDALDTEFLEVIPEGNEGDDAYIESLVCNNCDIIVNFVFPPNPVVDYDEDECPIYADPDREDDSTGWVVWETLTGWYEAS